MLYDDPALNGMAWASASGERTYNLALGLTSPRVLREYLATPEDFVGIEHLLRGQGVARASLARFHWKAFLEGDLGRDDDPELLAEESRNRAVTPLSWRPAPPQNELHSLWVSITFLSPTRPK